MDKSEIRIILKYEFLRGTKAAETARNINRAFGNHCISERTVRFRFEKFRAGNFDLRNEPRGRPEVKVNNDKLKAFVEENPTLSARELANHFQVSKPTILAHLVQIGKVNRLKDKTKKK